MHQQQMFNPTFKALLKEAQFTKEMLGAGATQIGKANYASKGIYFQAFTSLSTGLERIGKLCLMLDYYADHNGQFPDSDFLKYEICHNIATIYEKSALIIQRRSISMNFQSNLTDPIHQAILSILSEFARGNRYSNINLLVGGNRQNDPIAVWFKQVDQPLYDTHIPQKKKDAIQRNAVVVAAMLGEHVDVRHTSELNQEVTDVQEASEMTGMYEAVAPYRRLYVLQVIRYWVELLSSLGGEAAKIGPEDIPYFDEMFRAFYNDDAYFKSRKTWDEV
jgi:hypothetical protein